MTIKRAILGYHTPPWLVAMLRGVIEAAVLAALAAAVYFLNGDSVPPELVPLAPLAVYVLRQLEGLADEKIDPTHNRLKGEGSLASKPTRAPGTRPR